MDRFIGFLLLAFVAFTAYALYDGYYGRPSSDPAIHLFYRVTTWQALNYDSMDFYGNNGFQQGSIFVTVVVDNETDKIIRGITVSGVANASGKAFETFKKACQVRNSTGLALAPHQSYIDWLQTNKMVCFVKLDSSFPTSANVTDAEREAAWAAVEAVTIDKISFDVTTSNQPMNYAASVMDSWTRFTNWVSTSVAWPFQRGNSA